MKTARIINVKFIARERVEKILETAIEKECGSIIKLRYTYVETELGIAELPPKLTLVLMINDQFPCLQWKLPEYSGSYTLRFER